MTSALWILAGLCVVFVVAMALNAWSEREFRKALAERDERLLERFADAALAISDQHRELQQLRISAEHAARRPPAASPGGLPFVPAGAADMNDTVVAYRGEEGP